MVKVSIIVPIYKVEKYLDRCVQSILGQTFTDFELILVDDGSPDRCGEICDEYAARDSRIRVIHQENAKVSAARNAGINVAKGKWLAFIDPDDWIHKDYLKILMNGVLDDTDIVLCDCVIASTDMKDDEVTDVKYKNTSLEGIQNDHIAVKRSWGRMIRADVIGELRYISGTEPAEDLCFNELLFEKNMHFRMTDAKLYYYYQRKDSAIHMHMGRGVLNATKTLIQHMEQIADPDKRKRIIARCYKNIFSARYGEMFTREYVEVLKQCKELLESLSNYRSELDMKDRMVFGMMSRLPWLYRMWRIHDDPTLKEFERVKKSHL